MVCDCLPQDWPGVAREAFLRSERLRDVDAGGSESRPYFGVGTFEESLAAVGALGRGGNVAELAECPRGPLLDLDAFAADETE